MRRVIVPLDGTEFAEAILPDARRLAGTGGELVLIQDASVAPYAGFGYFDMQEQLMKASRDYLDKVASRLRADGVTVQTHTMVAGNAALAIDEAARIFHADMIAIATHARSGIGRLVHGSTTWRALAHSAVPVLVRHIGPRAHGFVALESLERRILVPLDGSTLAEKALPVARQLAGEWNAEISLVQVVFTLETASGTPALNAGDAVYSDIESATREAEAYLRQVAASLGSGVHAHVLMGSTIDALVAATDAWLISDVVTTSHGRTGLSRVILGSVADALLHRLDLPIVVVPALAAQSAVQLAVSGQRLKSDSVPV